MTGRRRTLVAVATMVVAAAAVACAPDGPDAPGTDGADIAPTEISSTDIAPSDISSADDAPTAIDVDGATAATVSIRARGCGPRTRFGVGTVVGEGVVVTVAHVVAGSDTVQVVGPDGRSVPVDVVWFDPDLDVAVLRSVTPVGTPIELSPTAPDSGPGIVLLPRLGREDGEVGVLDVEVVRAVTIRTTDIYRTVELERSGVEVAARIEAGDSGAMVHTPGGNSGIIWARSSERSDRAWAVDLPDVVVDEAERLVTPVDVQRCVD